MPDETQQTPAPITTPSPAQPAEPVIPPQPTDSITPEPLPEPSEAPTNEVNMPEVTMTTPENTPLETPISEPAPTPEITETPVNSTPNPEPTPQPAQPQPTPETQVSPVVSLQPNFLTNLLTKARESIQFRKRKKLDKIMELVNKKGKVSNNDITNLLRVSDATATRYLNTLEKEGKVKQDGKTGKSVFYSRI
ncbi:MAG: DeoR family transcriptional regulator [bacterium]